MSNIRMIEELSNVQPATLKVYQRMKDLALGKCYDRKIKWKALWKVNPKLEDTTFVSSFMHKEYAVPAFCHLEVDRI